MKADQLLDFQPFELDENQKRDVFLEALAETLTVHCRGNQSYREYCQRRGFNPENGVENLADVPYLPIQLFKKFPFLTVPKTEIVDTRKSSSTISGTPSVVRRDRLTLDRYFRSRNLIFDQFINDRDTIHICVGTDPATDTSLSRNLINTLIAGRSGSEKTYYLIDETVDQHKVDVDLFLDVYRNAEHDGKRIGLIFGGTAFVYLYFLKVLKERNTNLAYDGYIAHGGGWKKLENQNVSKAIFTCDVEAVFNCGADKIKDMYGFAESNSIFIDCEAGYKHMPVWNEVLVRDPVTTEPLERGIPGLLQIFDALPNSYAGASLLSDDIGFVSPEKKCPCGRNGTAFRIIRRARGSEAKGCGDMMVEHWQNRNFCKSEL
jgi:hypothetical protein